MKYTYYQAELRLHVISLYGHSDSTPGGVLASEPGVHYVPRPSTQVRNRC